MPRISRLLATGVHLSLCNVVLHIRNTSIIRSQGRSVIMQELLQCTPESVVCNSSTKMDPYKVEEAPTIPMTPDNA
ncbi:hypothetical protein BDV24DRAFT_106912 [Aspergillus arachidicola]|uniref:Uncharacterized protein n=1 Tax=Aspergillus arachidicola TaxID=656916 RepID=A0A5N6XUG9_9EURO|nr:hypothetical protein BDV24DRAFT_106912 [Aspergillus arachidicola]